MWEDIKSIKEDLCEGLVAANSELRKAKKDFLEKARECLRAEKALRREVGVLLRKIKRKAEEIESRLKEIKDWRKRECEKNKKWEGPCKFFVSIPYWGWLTAIYTICLSAIISISVIYGIAILLGLIAYVATAIIFFISYISTATILFILYTLVVAIIWLGILGFFLIHWAFRVTIVPAIIVLIPFLFWLFALLVHKGYVFISGEITGATVVDSVAFVSSMPILKMILDSCYKQIQVLYKKVMRHRKKIYKNLKNLLLPPGIEIIKGIKKTGCNISGILENITAAAVSTLSLILLALLALAVGASSAVQAVDKVTDTKIVHNDVRLAFRSTAPRSTVPLVTSVPDCPDCPPTGKDGEDDKRALFTTMVSFPYEAKAQDWMEGRYDPNNESSKELSKTCSDNQVSHAVEPDEKFYRPLLKSFLKGLSDCGDAEGKVMLQTVGFASSSGLSAGNNALMGKLKEKSCYERTGGNGDQRLSNAFNLCMAELRASNVKKMLDKIIRDDDAIDHIEVKAHKWDSYSQMCRQRGFADTGKENDAKCYDSELGLMNRRVEVWVMELPGCTSFFPNNRTPPGEAEEVPLESQGNTCDSRELPASCKAGAAVDSCPNAGCQEDRRSEP